MVRNPTLLLLSALFLIHESWGDTLPYTRRVHSFSGWSTVVEGDLRSVGMAGADVGLPSTFMGASDNPAGLAMTVNGADANLVSNVISDGAVQSYSNPLNESALGFVSTAYPWGFGLSSIGRTQEGQDYLVAAAPGGMTRLSLTTNNVYFSVSRVFFENKLSLGASLIFGQVEEKIEAPNLVLSQSASNVNLGLGASFQLPHRILLGASVLPSSRFIFPTTPATSPIPDFFQTTEIPIRIGLGVGWLPNRFFRADYSMLLVGPTSNTALLKDDSTLVGKFWTLQPRIGAAYRVFDYKELQVSLNFGTYLEVSRIDQFPTRLHGTVTIDVAPWIFCAGLGIDASGDYRNYLASVGLNVIKIMTKLDLIPKFWSPPHSGAFPNPFHASDADLPRPLVKHWSQHGPEINPIEIGMALPDKIEKKAKEISNDISSGVKNIGSGVSEMFEPSAPKKSSRRRPTPARSHQARSNRKSARRPAPTPHQPPRNLHVAPALPNH